MPAVMEKAAHSSQVSADGPAHLAGRVLMCSEKKQPAGTLRAHLFCSFSLVFSCFFSMAGDVMLVVIQKATHSS